MFKLKSLEYYTIRRDELIPLLRKYLLIHEMTVKDFVKKIGYKKPQNISDICFNGKEEIIGRLRIRTIKSIYQALEEK